MPYACLKQPQELSSSNKLNKTSKQNIQHSHLFVMQNTYLQSRFICICHAEHVSAPRIQNWSYFPRRTPSHTSDTIRLLCIYTELVSERPSHLRYACHTFSVQLKSIHMHCTTMSYVHQSQVPCSHMTQQRVQITSDCTISFQCQGAPSFGVTFILRTYRVISPSTFRNSITQISSEQ